MKPYLLGLLFDLFLSFPGLLLKIAGAVGAFCCVVPLATESELDLRSDLRLMAYTLIAALTFASGSAMRALPGMLEAGDKKSWQGDSPRIVAIRISLSTLALLAGCAAVAVLAYLGRGMWLAALLAFGGVVLLAAAALAIQNSGGSFADKQEPEGP